MKVLLRSEETDGQVSMVELNPKPGFGPPLHQHDFDETFYVMEGEVTFQVRDEVLTRRTGELAFAPRNVPHTYANLSDADARMVMVVTPAGFERYFDKMAAEQAGVEPPPEVAKGWPKVDRLGPGLADA